MKSSRALGAILLAAGLGAACVGVPPSGAVFVRVGPPRPVYEARTVAPGPGYVWISGYHRWDGASHVWVAGRWERAPEGRRRWVPGRWRSYQGQWYWVEGHWR